MPDVLRYVQVDFWADWKRESGKSGTFKNGGRGRKKTCLAISYSRIVAPEQRWRLYFQFHVLYVVISLNWHHRHTAVILRSHCRSDQLDQARSRDPRLVGSSGRSGSTLVNFLHDYCEHVRNSQVEIGKSSAREAVGKWSGISELVAVELIGYWSCRGLLRSG